MAPTPLQQLNEHGQSVWVDYLSRSFIEDGELGGLADAGVHGVTSNPTIFQAAIAEGDAYDEQLKRGARDGERAEGDLPCARHPGHQGGVRRAAADPRRGTDGWVSLEVDPNLAHDTDGTIKEAKRLTALVDKPNLFVKIPATKEGLPAIEETIAAASPST